MRISVDRNGDLLGVERQLPPIKVLLKRLHWDLAESYVDDDVTISRVNKRRRKARDGWDRMLGDAAAGTINAIVALDYTRLMRDPKAPEQLIDFTNAHGIALATASGELDLATSSGRLQFRLLGAIAAHEAELASERQKRRHQQRAEAGLDAGGTRAFGRADDRVTPHPVEAPIVEDLADRILKGAQVYRLAAELNDRGILTPMGNRWHPSTLKRTLVSPRVIGARERHGVIVKEDAYTPILDRDVWEQVRAILLDPERVGGRPAEYLLTGLLIHAGAECRVGLVGSMDHGHRSYACKTGGMHRGCGRLTVRATWIEDLVVDAVLDALAGPKLRQAIAEGAPVRDDARGRELLGEIRALEAREGQLADLHRDGILDAGGYQRASAGLEQRIAILRQQRSTGRPTPVLDGLPHDRPGLGRWWNDQGTSIDRKRALLSEILERIEVKAGQRGRLDPGRVLPDGLIWRV
jgi:site-specific DNA recombinase